jgi:hypothetical protein
MVEVKDPEGLERAESGMEKVDSVAEKAEGEKG